MSVDIASMITLPPDGNITGDLNITGWPTNDSTSYPDVYGDSGGYNEEYMLWASRTTMMWRVMCPIVFIVGNFGNIMIMLVLKTMVSDASAFPLLLMALAVSDLLLLYIVLLPRWIFEQFGHWIIDKHDVVCKIFTWLEYSLVSLSAWLLAAMTAHRALNIVCAIRMRRVKPRLLAAITIGVLVGASLVFNSFTLHGMTTEDPASKGFCLWYVEFEASARYVLDWLEIQLNFTLPAVVMVVSNCFMIRAVLQTDQRARKRKGDAMTGMVSRVTVTLIVVSAVFIVLTLPYYVTQIIIQRNPSLDFSGPHHFWFNIAGLLWIVNSAVNFFLYILTGSRFRAEGKRMASKVIGSVSGEPSSSNTHSTSDSAGSQSASNQMQTTDF